MAKNKVFPSYRTRYRFDHKFSDTVSCLHIEGHYSKGEVYPGNCFGAKIIMQKAELSITKHSFLYAKFISVAMAVISMKS